MIFSILQYDIVSEKPSLQANFHRALCGVFQVIAFVLILLHKEISSEISPFSNTYASFNVFMLRKRLGHEILELVFVDYAKK